MERTLRLPKRNGYRDCLRLARCALPRWRELLTVLASMLLVSGVELLKPWPLKLLVDYALYGRPLPSELSGALAWLPGPLSRERLAAACIAGTVLLFLLGWAATLTRTCMSMAFSKRMVYDLAADLFAHLQRLSLRYHARRSVGDSVRRLTTDCGAVSNIVLDALLPLASIVFGLVAMFAIMWRLDPVLSLLSLLAVPYMVWVFRRYSDPIQQRSYEQQETEGQLYSLVEETFTSIPVVQAFTREEDADRRFRECSRNLVRATLATTDVQFQFKILMGLATAAGTAGILWIGTRHVLEGKLTVGGILVFLSYLASLYGPLEALMYTPSTLQNAAGSARRVLEILETAPEVQEAPGATPLPPLRGDVRLEDVTFGYDPARPVLRRVSLHLRPGETLALVGATGAGKSTLASLLPRFFDPDQGRVLLDGVDVRTVQLRSLREQVALVLQEPFLFPITLAQNIAYGRPDASPEQIEAAARAANAHAFITRLPQGYDTVVGERGATLSGGERQRVAIARALLKDAPVLILDEPTNALDAETERLLLEAVERLTEGRTTLVIAHRLSTIRRADRIVVLADGEVVEQGTHAELLARGGRYAHLYRLQSEEPGAVPVGVSR